jgi:hypothetical protein
MKLDAIWKRSSTSTSLPLFVTTPVLFESQTRLVQTDQHTGDCSDDSRNRR